VNATILVVEYDDTDNSLKRRCCCNSRPL